MQRSVGDRDLEYKNGQRQGYGWAGCWLTTILEGRQMIVFGHWNRMASSLDHTDIRCVTWSPSTCCTSSLRVCIRRATLWIHETVTSGQTIIQRGRDLAIHHTEFSIINHQPRCEYIKPSTFQWKRCAVQRYVVWLEMIHCRTVPVCVVKCIKRKELKEKTSFF